MYYCFYIICTGNTRPTLRDLHLHVVEEAAHKWRELGALLGLKYYKINLIAAYHPHDDVMRCGVVLERWLQTTPYASWNQLIRALRSPSVQLDSLAEQLEEKMLGIKCKIYSNITTNCTL